jgi:hypothetical protein
MHACHKPCVFRRHAPHARVLDVALGGGIAALVAVAPLHAQGVDPCTVYTCMAGVSGAGTSGGPACTPALAYWHGALAVYSPLFNPPASAARRESYLRTCPGASYASNAALLKAIIAAWGWVP